MVKKNYDWSNGAELDDHSRRKHKILREYIFEYIRVRCSLPQQERFRLVFVDGFSGAGKYKCGSPGSPIIFMEELKNAIDSINIQRGQQGLKLIEIDCLMILNDFEKEVVELLKTHVLPAHLHIRQSQSKINLDIKYLNGTFEGVYQEIKKYLDLFNCRNVLFNLDQCGHKHVKKDTILDIMRFSSSVEIFYTFAIESLLAFLHKDKLKFRKQLLRVGVEEDFLPSAQDVLSNNGQLGIAEKLVFQSYKSCALYVSPFSIHNPDGWRYWFIHFSNNFRARQVYNNILHNNSNSQAHFGRSGLNMLSYNPLNDQGALYLFDVLGRASAKDELMEDIPRLVSETGDVLGVRDFYEGIYNLTPAHADDIHSAIIENPDIEVITQYGGSRRKANSIKITDTIKLKNQRSFFSVLR